MSIIDWVRGDLLGLELPAHAAALRAGGESFLTTAFRATGALAPDNRVSRIEHFEECPGGSTGRKLMLSVRYEKPVPNLPTELFVKFSRDFDDPIRDRAKIQMASEVRFGLLSRTPGFPIAVPICLYADYHTATGTGILISERIKFGIDGIERHYGKCLDHELPEPLAHYRALVRALARLAGTHRSGRLPRIAEHFPFEPHKLAVSERSPYTPKQLQNRVARYAEFAARCPQLLPATITAQTFIDKLAAEVGRFPEHEAAIRQFLQSNPDLIALCHWNANIDNAWFWKDANGELQCGLMDWGHASQMNVAMSLWGCLSGAETELWKHHLDELLELFVREFQAAGGPALDLAELRFHLDLYIALMGLTWLLDAPALIRLTLPDVDQATDRLDPRITGNELVRSQLQMMTTFLSLWQAHDFGAVLDKFLRRTQPVAN